MVSSAVVLQPRLKIEVFVANRVGKILGCFEEDKLRWVDGKSNSADQLSRGIRGDETGRWQHFLHGPSWLALPEEFWPQGPTRAELAEEDSVEVGFVTVVNQETTAEPRNCDKEDNGLHAIQVLASKTNDFDTLLRRVRLLRQFGEQLRNKVARRQGREKPFSPSGARERAVISIIKYVQGLHFPKKVAHFQLVVTN